MDQASSTFLAAECAKTGALQPFFTQAQVLYDKKLWHELSCLILSDLLPLEAAKPKLEAIWTNFIVAWQHKMKPLTRVIVSFKPHPL
jgi:hypothetical protein